MGKKEKKAKTLADGRIWMKNFDWAAGEYSYGNKKKKRLKVQVDERFSSVVRHVVAEGHV